MRFILRKYVDADNAADALHKDTTTPVHDVYLKEGEEPRKSENPKDLIGFWHETPIGLYEGEPANSRKK